MPVASVLSAVGAPSVQLWGRLREIVESIVAHLIGLFRQVLDWVYSLQYYIWTKISEDPFNALYLFANVWVLMA